MKTDDRAGDKVKIIECKIAALHRGCIGVLRKSPFGISVYLYKYCHYCDNGKYINFSAIGRKAAQASKNKVTRDEKGRFKKKEYEGITFTVGKVDPLVFLAVGGGGGTDTPAPTLESLEKRIEALERKAL